MKLIMENWRSFLNESVIDLPPAMEWHPHIEGFLAGKEKQTLEQLIRHNDKRKWALAGMITAISIGAIGIPATLAFGIKRHLQRLHPGMDFSSPAGRLLHKGLPKLNTPNPMPPRPGAPPPSPKPPLPKLRDLDEPVRVSRAYRSRNPIEPRYARARKGDKLDRSKTAEYFEESWPDFIKYTEKLDGREVANAIRGMLEQTMKNFPWRI